MLFVDHYFGVIGNTGIVTKRCVENVKYLDCDIEMSWLQKMAANETANLVSYLIGGKVKKEEMSPASPEAVNIAEINDEGGAELADIDLL